MGRIPRLLPLDVKPSENGARHDTPARVRSLASGEARRSSYAASGADTCTPRCSLHGKDRASAAGDEHKFAAGSDGCCARTDSGLHSSHLHPHPPHHLAPLPKPASSVSSMSPCSSLSHVLTGSDTECSAASNVVAMYRSTGSSSDSNRNTTPPSTSTAQETPTTSSNSHGTAPTASAPISTAATGAHGSATAALLSRFSHRALNVSCPGFALPALEAPGPAPGFPSAAKPPPSLSGAALARLALSSCSNAEQQLRELTETRSCEASCPSLSMEPQPVQGQGQGRRAREEHLSAPLPPLSGLISPATTHTSFSPLPQRQLRPPPAGLTMQPAETVFLPSCASPVSLPSPGGQADAGAGGGGCGGRTAMSTSMADLLVGPAAAVATGSDGSATKRRVRLTCSDDGGGQTCGSSGGGDGGGASSASNQQQQPYGGGGGGGGGGGVRKLANMLRNMMPAAGKGGGAPDGPAASSSAGASPPVPPGTCAGLTAAALRIVAELQTRDEFSLVAAARQRQLVAQRTLSKQATLSRRGLAAQLGGRSFHAGRLQGDLPSPLQAGLSLRALPLPAMETRTSCPDLGCPETTRALVSIVDALRDERGPSREQPGATAADAAAATVAATTDGGSERDGKGSSSGGAPDGVADASGSPKPAAEGHGGTGAGVDSGGSGGGAGTAAVTGFLPALVAHSGTGGGGGGGVAVSNRSLTGMVGTSGAAAAAAAAAARGGGSAPARQTLPGVGELGKEAGSESDPVSSEGATAAAPVPPVQALTARFGTMDGGPRGVEVADQDPALLERRRKVLLEALQAANPAAYHEDAAEAAEAAYRALSERAQLKLRRLLEEASTREAPLRQLEDALRELTSQRPFFLPPVIVKPKVERTFVEARDNSKPAWNVDESLFAQRKKDSESRELYDTEKIRLQQLNLDWRRVVGKTRFRRMVARGDLGVKEDGQSLDEELAEVREELVRQGGFIRAAFVYYSMMSGGATMTSSDVLQISLTGWLAFCNDAGVVGRGCSTMDMQNIFVAVNFEEESETAEADANDDDAMVRFEFMEGLVRAAFNKYIATKKMTDASDALGALLEEVTASSHLPPEVRVDPNEFRRTRFYCSEVEDVVREYLDLLTGMFKLYKARDRAKFFWPEHFMAFLDSNQLLSPATGLHRRDAKLIFAWSQALVTDELRRRQRAVSLTFWDFVEAIARLADFISPPDKEDMAQFFLAQGQEPPDLDRIVYEYYKTVGDAGPLLRSPSSGLLASAAPSSLPDGGPTRPLACKLRLLLEYLVSSLREAWGGADAREVAAKVARTANYLCGGIEMG